MFAETLLVRANEVTTKRGARTLTPSHLKFCIESEARFDFLRDLVSSVPDLQSEAAAEGGSGGGEAGGGAAASSWAGEAYAPRQADKDSSSLIGRIRISSYFLGSG